MASKVNNCIFSHATRNQIFASQQNAVAVESTELKHAIL